MKPRADQGGAALLAFLLIAVVALSAVLLSAFGGMNTHRAREERTLALLAQASEALVGFAATHGRLPRPVDASGGGNAGGHERREACANEADCTGLLPWRDLGLPAQDVWGRELRYSVTPAFTLAPLARTTLVASKRVLTRDAGGALSFSAGQDTCTLAAQCAPAVIISRGSSDHLAGRDETANLAASVDFMYRPHNREAGAPGGAFDDLLAVVPLQTLYERMAAAKTLP